MNEALPTVVASGATRTAGLLLDTVTVTPPCCEAPSVAPAASCSPAPTVCVAGAVIAGWGLTVTETESETTPAADAVTVVVQGSVAVPPYAGSNVALTRPVGIVTDDAVETHAAFAGVSVTTRAGCAAIGVPLLSRRTVSVGGVNPLLKVAVVWRMFSSALLVTAVAEGE